MNEAMVMTQDHDTGLIWVEQLPDYVNIGIEFLNAADGGFVEKSGNPDDGYTVVFRFANGVAVYELGELRRLQMAEPFSQYEYEGYHAMLRSWSPSI